MTNTINTLLHEVEKLAVARKEREREAQKRGEKFNVLKSWECSQMRHAYILHFSQSC